jgi:hypothetical protein
MVQDADEEGESLWSASKDDSLSDKGKYWTHVRIQVVMICNAEVAVQMNDTQPRYLILCKLKVQM